MHEESVAPLPSRFAPQKVAPGPVLGRLDQQQWEGGEYDRTPQHPPVKGLGVGVREARGSLWGGQKGLRAMGTQDVASQVDRAASEASSKENIGHLDQF